MRLTLRQYLEHEWSVEEMIFAPESIRSPRGKYFHQRSSAHYSPLGRDWRSRPYVTARNSPKNILCLGSFSPSTDQHTSYQGTRAAIINALRDEKFIEWSYSSGAQWPFLRNLKQSQFCLSPRGNSPDCFRTWDALYEKCVPIVEPSSALLRYRELPILFMDDLREITRGLLEKSYEVMLQTTYDFSLLKKSHWIKV